MKDALWLMEMAGVGWHLGLEPIYLGLQVTILAQRIQDSESREVVLP